MVFKGGQKMTASSIEENKMARFIAAMRKAKNLTQKELAEPLGVTDKAVSKWERGLSCPDIALIVPLAQALGVTPGELLTGEKADASPAAPEAETLVSAALQYAETAQKDVLAQRARWKAAAIAAMLLLASLLALIGASAILQTGLAGFALPVGLTAAVWLAALTGAFAWRKNRVGALLLAGLLIYATTYFYATLNQPPVSAEHFSPGFPRLYLPHYTVILALFTGSIALAVAAFRTRAPSGERNFLLATLSLTAVILSILSVPAIMEYVDLHGLGVDARFTILLLATILLNCVTLVKVGRNHAV
jgi:transcriptional regulator with XRE-family HTH domain